MVISETEDLDKKINSYLPSPPFTNKNLRKESEIALILPAYNEEKNIGFVLSNIPSKISQNLDIIVVNDGSSDRTAKIAENYDTLLINHRENKGNGAATITGLNYCKEKDYDLAIILDADGQHDPNFIPLFIKAISEENIDFVIGNRFEYYYDMKPIKKICSKLLTVFYFFVFRKIISDPSNGYRALSKTILQNISFKSSYSITQEMLFKILPKYKFKEIPIKLRSRREGKSFIKIKKYLWIMIIFFLKFFVLARLNSITLKLFKKSLNDILGIHYLEL
ncbi:MAG: glycosyltransferase [Candidatus Lokiarchaeota archaeon]|nr:glycosyltransferase [Candidatus Lokiarchaeota archaeon]MBD3202205.1 glycosyltransferase [Candidatus Lokiarchaeota archaeon]